jgi:hypothetical protein
MSDSWRQLYLDALNETRIERLESAVMAVEGAIFERWQELGESPGHVVERAAIQAATDELLMIKVEKLGWPPLNLGNQHTSCSQHILTPTT